MLHKGAARPAYIGVTYDDKAAGEARHNGFLKALSDYNIKMEKHYSTIVEFNIDSGCIYACCLITGLIFIICIQCRYI